MFHCIGIEEKTIPKKILALEYKNGIKIVRLKLGRFLLTVLALKKRLFPKRDI